MTKILRHSFFAFIFGIITIPASSQSYTFEDFVGTWHGTYSSSWNNINNIPITMVIHSDGYYTETTGFFMPSLYPNTQQCNYQASTNRFHWWYLSVVYAGQQTYTHFYYEVVKFQNDTLQLHYNFWDDDEPNPDAGILILVNESTTPPPTNLLPTIINGELSLSWDAPDNGDSPIDVLEGYNVYSSFAQGDFVLLAFTEETSFLIENGATAGLHSYYITAVYEENESESSDQLFMLFDTPEPDTLMGEPMQNRIDLEWTEPASELGPRATLLGYNVFHKYENEEFAFVEFSQSTNFIHEELNNGSHQYYVTAVYDGGESEPSIGINILLAEATTPPPTNLLPTIINGELSLSWDEPDNGDSPIDVLEGYNVYSSFAQGDFVLLGFTEETSFLIENGATAGLHSYYITAVYEENESESSDQLFMLFDTPEPDTLMGEPMENKIDLEWSEPASELSPRATLLGYNVFHKYENEEFAFVEFSESTNFIHEGLVDGIHHYYITAVYDGGESEPSSEIEVTVMVATNLLEIDAVSFNLYPNPARKIVFIENGKDIQNIKIINQAGQTLKSIDDANFTLKIDISDLKTGIYFVTIKTSKELIAKKLLVR